MPRFSDSWVVDKCMFDYVNGGDCACCGLPHLFAPGGLEGMINSMSDLETDAATREINAAKTSPWPPDMREQIWSDRLLLRFRMKKEMKVYRAFLEGVVRDRRAADGDETDAGEIDIDDAVPILREFCTNELSPRQIRGIFQLPRSELTEVLKSKYKICSAFGVVFCTVVEQVSNFKVTRYGVDARSGAGDDDSEEAFENELMYKKVGPGFCLNIGPDRGVGGSGDDGVDDDVLLMFLRRMVGLAGPTLLARAAKIRDDDDGDGSDDGSDGEVDGAEKGESNTPSFRSDRRVARLLIARYWADRLIEKYNGVQKKKKGERTIENVEVVQ